MKRDQKEQVVDELTQRLQAAETLLVADYRGLTMPQIDDLRTKLLEHGARFSVVKNTLTRRAAELAGADALLIALAGLLAGFIAWRALRRKRRATPAREPATARQASFTPSG